LLKRLQEIFGCGFENNSCRRKYQITAKQKCVHGCIKRLRPPQARQSPIFGRRLQSGNQMLLHMLNRRGVKTASGKPWQAMQIIRIRNRLGL
jgi:hypothetical protein